MKKILVKIIRGMMFLASKLPLKFHYFMGDVLSWLAKNVIRYRSGIVWMNISRSFPEMKSWHLKKVYNGFYRHFGEIVAETIWFGGSDYKRLLKAGIVKIKNPEVLSDAFSNSPSVTLLCSHCGNWELLGGFIGYMTEGGRPCSFTEKELSVVYKKQTNSVGDAILAINRLNPLPEKSPYNIIETKNILRFSIENKASKRVYIYPADQAPYRDMGRHDMGMFLNQRTYAMTGSVGVACKLSHAVVYMTMKSVERGKYEWEFVSICDDASKFSPDEIMKKYYSLLEKDINETPHNWLWSHNRWKTNGK